MTRDVLIEAMRRGQLPLLAYATIVVLVIWKTPSAYFPTLWGKLFELRGSIMGGSVTLNIILTFGWYFSNKNLRQRFKDESSRIIDERNALQVQCGALVKSSRK